jgi:hypothetical protein
MAFVSMALKKAQNLAPVTHSASNSLTVAFADAIGLSGNNIVTTMALLFSLKQWRK